MLSKIFGIMQKCVIKYFLSVELQLTDLHIHTFIDVSPEDRKGEENLNTLHWIVAYN